MPQDKEKYRYKKLLILLVIFIALIDLIFIFYIKYDNRYLTLSDFRLYYIGNQITIILSLLLIIGLIVYFFSRRSRLAPLTILFHALLMTLFLFISWIFLKYRITLPDISILNQPFERVFVSGLFCIYQFIQFFLIIEIWMSLSGKTKSLLLKSFVDSVLASLVLLILSFLYLNFHEISPNVFFLSGKGVNVGVVLGAAVWTDEPSPSLKARVDKAVELYKDGSIQKIQLTGGNAPGELSEAEIAYRYIKSKKIDTSDVWIEKETKSTIEQVQFIKSDLVNKPQINDIIVISDSYHLPRVLEIADFYLLDIKAVPSDLYLKFENKLYNKARESAAILIFWFFGI